MQKRIENIIKEVAEELKVPYEVAKAVWESQNMCTRVNMAEGEHNKIDTFLNIRWRNFGTFYVKPSTIAGFIKYGELFKNKKNIKD